MGEATQIAQARRFVQNRPLFVLTLIAGLGAYALPFLAHAPNRLISGQSIWLVSVQPVHSAFLAALGGALLAGAFLRQRSWLLNGLIVVAALSLGTLSFMAGIEASTLAANSAASSRTSFGAGFWVISCAITLIIADLLHRAGHGASQRFMFGLCAIAPIAVMVWAGQLDQLSVMKEYTSKVDIFQQAVLRHIVIVVGALMPTLLLGVPLGVLAFRKAGFGQGLLTGLNIIQTIPSIALFGLLMAPLSALAQAMPALRAFGVSGIGLAPAIIALTLYCLLPIVRNTLEGLAQVPAPIVDAARGMGMTARQIFWQVQVPLALPVFLAGLRITLVQAIGLAAIAALIGAGGLGSILFQGLFANALDLVLLGALPIIAMVVIVDMFFALCVDKTRNRTQ